MPARAKSPSRVVFHADDFGMNVAINEGILLSFRDGLLTSTSLLANAPAAEQACQAWQELVADHASESLKSTDARRRLDDPRMTFDLGIHLNLTQGRPLTGDRYPAELLDAQGHFPGIGALFFRLKRADSSSLEAVKVELWSQVERMCDHGLTPTHLNGHQYIELIPQISAMIPAILARYSIKVVRVAREPNLLRNVLGQGRPLAWGMGLVKRYFASNFIRSMRREDALFPDCFFGTSHAGRVDLRTLERFLGNSPQHGCTEIGLHPSVTPTMQAQTLGMPWFDPLALQRSIETEWLCSPELPALLNKRGIDLGRLQSLNSN